MGLRPLSSPHTASFSCKLPPKASLHHVSYGEFNPSVSVQPSRTASRLEVGEHFETPAR